MGRYLGPAADLFSQPYHLKYGYSGKTTLESTHGCILSLEDGHELMADIVSHSSSFIQPEDKEDHTVSDEAAFVLCVAAYCRPKTPRETSAAIVGQGPQALHRAEMEAVLRRAFSVIGFHDPFFEILGTASFTGIPRLQVEPATRYSSKLTESIYDVVAALQKLEPFPTTLQK